MDFLVLRKTASENLLLVPALSSSAESGGKPAGSALAKGISRMLLFQGSEAKAEVFDTIASVEKPFYLAKPLGAENLVGKTLSSRKGKKAQEGKKSNEGKGRRKTGSKA